MTDRTDESIALSPDRDQMVRVSDLKKHYPVQEGVLRRQVDSVRAVDGVSFTIPTGDTFGLVGESGSGKTTVGKNILRVEEPTSGRVEINGQDLSGLSRAELREFRQHMQLVFQDPSSSLNPRKRVRDIITDPMDIHGVGTRAERIERVEELLDIVGLPREYMYRYPSSLSGGQKQRVGIARAVALNPEFLVLDEPTSALDVSVQARIISLFESLQTQFDLTYLFISHDLSLVKSIADWIGVMYLGRLVEVGPSADVFRNPQHPYTRALLAAIPTVREEDEELTPGGATVEGEIPDPRDRPSGCAFRSRCPDAFDACANRVPPLYRVGENHFARCLLHDDDHATRSASTAWIERPTNPRGPQNQTF